MQLYLSKKFNNFNDISIYIFFEKYYFELFIKIYEKSFK